MTTITILPEAADSYRALAGEKESTGRTAGEALDALTAQLAEDESGTLVIVQNRKADKFFTAPQQERLAELMQLSEARHLSTEEERELESLVEAELVGARRRASVLTGANPYSKEEFDKFVEELDKFAEDNRNAKILNATILLEVLTKMPELERERLIAKISEGIRGMKSGDLMNELKQNLPTPANSNIVEKTD